MELNHLFIILFIAAIAWHLVTSGRIISYFQAKGEKINWILIRMLLPHYASRYQKLTRDDKGQSGPLFWQYIVSINAALLFALIAILMKKGVLH